MKKLSKLQINPEKIMKNEELLTLKGGNDCYCYKDGTLIMVYNLPTFEHCESECRYLGATSWAWVDY